MSASFLTDPAWMCQIPFARVSSLNHINQLAFGHPAFLKVDVDNANQFNGLSGLKFRRLSPAK